MQRDAAALLWAATAGPDRGGGGGGGGGGGSGGGYGGIPLATSPSALFSSASAVQAAPSVGAPRRGDGRGGWAGASPFRRGSGGGGGGGRGGPPPDGDAADPSSIGAARLAWPALAANAGVLAAKAAVAWRSSSLAVAAAAVDSLLDVVAQMAALAAARKERFRADAAEWPLSRSRLEPVGVCASLLLGRSAVAPD